MPDARKHSFYRYEGRFISSEADDSLMAALPPHLRADIPGHAQDSKFAFDGPGESVEEEMDYAAPCPDCNKFARAAYEDGRLKHHLAHRSDPDPDADRQRKVEKAKKEFGL